MCEEFDDDLAEDLDSVRERVAAVNNEVASAVEQASRLREERLAPMQLENTHQELIDAAGELRTALDRIEQVMDKHGNLSEPTPRSIKDDHADRLKEQYEGPVLNLALVLVEQNRRRWLHEKPDTNGALSVRRQGLTENQRTWLNELADSWEEHDG